MWKAALQKQEAMRERRKPMCPAGTSKQDVLMKDVEATNTTHGGSKKGLTPVQLVWKWEEGLMPVQLVWKWEEIRGCFQ